jgi:hypothetical protein
MYALLEVKTTYENFYFEYKNQVCTFPKGPVENNICFICNEIQQALHKNNINVDYKVIEDQFKVTKDFSILNYSYRIIELDHVIYSLLTKKPTKEEVDHINKKYKHEHFYLF